MSEIKLIRRGLAKSLMSRLYRRDIDYLVGHELREQVAKVKDQLKQSPDNAKQYYELACSKNRRYEQKYAYLVQAVGGSEVRASEAAKIYVMVEWDYE